MLPQHSHSEVTMKLKTPHLSKMLEEDKFEEALKAGEKRLEDPWENYEVEKCGVCGGTGVYYKKTIPNPNVMDAKGLA